MKTALKYDVAISVAEEDKEVAKQVAAALKQYKVRCYYYEEQAAESWGEYIINLTADAYGRRSRFVLMITSKHFIRKYWSNIERQIALANPRNEKPHILQLRLDETSIDGISIGMVYRDWQNNPQEIALLLKKKVRLRKLEELGRKAKTSLVIGTALTAIFLTYFFTKPKDRIRPGLGLVRQIEKVFIAGPSIVAINPQRQDTTYLGGGNSFYISNTEITVAQFLEYCNNQGKPFPPQPVYTYENSPIVNVTWQEANEYCQWAGGRLPSETEWEYAAGAALLVKYSGGNNAKKVGVYGRVKPACVGTKLANQFGLFDMTGNVAEWCSDWSDASNTWKSVRGGSYNSKINPVNELAITYRAREKPDSRQPYIGFRVVWDK